MQANNGVVTLAGTVDNEAQRDAASRQAASVPGVKTVINNLQVGQMLPSNPPAPQGRRPGSTEAPAPPLPAKPEPGARRMPRPASAMRIRRFAKTQSATIIGSDDSQMAPNNRSAQPSIRRKTARQLLLRQHCRNAARLLRRPAPKKLIIDQGTQMTVRLIDPIDSEKNQTGDTFHATLNAPLTSDGEEAIPAGVELTGHLVEVKSAGKFAGKSAVVMQLDSLKSGGRTYNLQTDSTRKKDPRAAKILRKK